MAYNFVVAERDQQFLMPPSMRDWLPEDHLAWFVIDVVDQLDLTRFRSSYRPDGHGRAAYDPAMMVAVLLYAYCSGLRSSRVIERRCVEDVAFRVLAGGHNPDHVTIARFRQRHADALAAVLVDSLRLCAEAGLVRLGVVALDGTRMAGNAAREANRTLADLDEEVARMLTEAEETDRSEDRNQRDDDLPPGLADRNGRLARLQAARQRLADTAEQRRKRFDDRTNALNQARAAKGLPPREFTPRPRSEAPQPDARANTTDPDSRLLVGRGGSLQGYNAQAVTTENQIIVAAEVTQDVNDIEQLEPMIAATQRTLEAAGIRQRPDALVADAGYWRASNVDGSITDAPELFINVARASRRGKPPQERRALGRQVRSPHRNDERSALDRARQGDAADAAHHDRADLRADQGCPRCSSVQPPRAPRRPGRMAAARRHPQPPQALAPQHRHRLIHRLARSRRATQRENRSKLTAYGQSRQGTAEPADSATGSMAITASLCAVIGPCRERDSESGRAA